MRGVILVLSSMLGCNGTVVEQAGGAASTTDASTAITSATTSASSSSTGLSCKQLRGEIQGAESRAMICDPEAAEQCTAVVDSICCRVTVNPSNVGWLELHAELMAELQSRPECAPDEDDCFMTCPTEGPGECRYDSRGAAQCYSEPRSP